MKAAGWTWAQVNGTAQSRVRDVGCGLRYEFGSHGFDSHKNLVFPLNLQFIVSPALQPTFAVTKHSAAYSTFIMLILPFPTCWDKVLRKKTNSEQIELQ